MNKCNSVGYSYYGLEVIESSALGKRALERALVGECDLGRSCPGRTMRRPEGPGCAQLGSVAAM